jgi:hypothetical protein
MDKPLVSVALSAAADRPSEAAGLSAEGWLAAAFSSAVDWSVVGSSVLGWSASAVLSVSVSLLVAAGRWD